MKLVKSLFNGLKYLIKKLRPIKDGVIYNKHGYTTYRDGFKDGFELHKSNTHIETYYRNGLKYGKFYKRYSDFMFIERGYYKNDKRHSFWNSTNNLEDTQIIGYYVNDTLEGLCNIFNKRKLSIGIFNNNIPDQLVQNFKITREFNVSVEEDCMGIPLTINPVNNGLILDKCIYYL